MRSIKLVFLLVGLTLSLPSEAQSDPLKSALNKLSSNTTSSQDSAANPQLTGVGRVNVIADSSIVQLEKRTRGFKETRGYRIQIMIGSIENIKTERNKFLSSGLPYSAYMKQIVPEYALQVGDFKTKMEVEKHLQIVREHYPKAFVVIDTIEPTRYDTKK